jgi:signal transduction histidine kinase
MFSSIYSQSTLSSRIAPDKLLDEQISSTLGRYPSVVIANLFGTVLLYFALLFFTASNQVYLHGWLLSQIANGIFGIVMYSKYYPDYSPIRSIWWRIEISAAFWLGLNWGLSWILFINPNDIHTAFFLNTTLCSVVVGMVVLSPLNRVALIVMLCSCLLPPIFRAFSIGGFLYNWIGIGTVLFLLLSLHFGQFLERLYLKMLYQREENMHLASELAREKQQVEKTSAEKTRFLAAASHDLRQPIQAMRLFENTLNHSLTEPAQREILNKISSARKGLTQLLENLLDISQLDSGIIQPEREWVFVDDVFFQLQQQYTDLAAEQNIELRIVSTNLQLNIDPTHLMRILGNLLNNAIKHMKRSGKILLGVRHSQGRPRIEVWDNGQGIPKHEQGKIFDEFYQVNNPERNRNKGLGLGLPIIKRLCHLNGYSLDFCSHFGKGSGFMLTLNNDEPQPFARPALKENTVNVETLPSAQLPAYRLLVLEDDQEVAQALQLLLSNWGMRVDVAHSINAALQICKNNIPDLILADYQLQHGETGLEAISRLQTLSARSIPALILTGNTHPDIVKMLSEKNYPVLYKPVEPEVLRTALVSLLPTDAST